MGEQEHRDLWEAVDGLREQQSVTNAMLVEIRTVLKERCEGRGGRIIDLEKDVETLKMRVWFFSGAAAALSAIGTKFMARLWP